MKSKKVLIVDNNDLSRKLFESLIGQLYSFSSVKNGLEAVEKASTEKFDIILMDIQMAGMDGITAAKKIRRQSPHQCPIIAITPLSFDSTRECLLDTGFEEVISKPIRPREFLKLLAATINWDNEDDSEETKQSDLEEVLDKNVLNQLLKYNSKIAIKSIYLDFLEEFDQLMDQINPALKSKDHQTLIQSIHTIKGNSGTLGSNAIFRLSSEADLQARASEWNYLEETLIKLKIERILLEKYIKEETTFAHE